MRSGLVTFLLMLAEGICVVPQETVGFCKGRENLRQACCKDTGLFASVQIPGVNSGQDAVAVEGEPEEGPPPAPGVGILFFVGGGFVFFKGISNQKPSQFCRTLFHFPFHPAPSHNISTDTVSTTMQGQKVACSLDGSVGRGHTTDQH